MDHNDQQDEPPMRYRSHPANVTADRLARHRKTYADKITDVEAQLLLNAIILLRQIAHHR